MKRIGRQRYAQVASSVLTAALAVSLCGGCSVQRMATNVVADVLAEGGDVYARDDDPALVGEAMPFALKTIESLLAQSPEHEELLLAAARGFTQYSYGWLQLPADYVESEDLGRAEKLRQRALGLYLRARDYGVRGLEVDRPGIGERLRRAPEEAVAAVGADDIDLLFWTGAAWGSAVGLGTDRPELMADLVTVQALLGRVLELDETYDRGAAHEAFITLSAVPAMMGGSLERATEHYERAVELARGVKASPHVAYAENVAVQRQDRAAFQAALERALAVDPDAAAELTLANRLAQKRARWLLERADELFVEPVAGGSDGPSVEATTDPATDSGDSP